MNKFFAIALTLAMTVSLAGVPGAAIAAHPSSHVCTVPNTIYIDQLDRCIKNVSDPVEMGKARDAKTGKLVPVALDYDAFCSGDGPDHTKKPAGFKFDVDVVGPDGAPGVEHRKCT